MATPPPTEADISRVLPIVAAFLLGAGVVWLVGRWQGRAGGVGHHRGSPAYGPAGATQGTSSRPPSEAPPTPTPPTPAPPPWIAAPWPTAPDEDPEQPTLSSVEELVALERRVHVLINEQRVAHGLRPLAWNDALLAPARDHSADMARSDYFAHNAADGSRFDTRYARRGVSCRVPTGGRRFLAGGENIYRAHRVAVFAKNRETGVERPVAWNDVESMAQKAVAGWMDSPGHRENILQPAWQSQAIGAAVDDQGRVYLTENFC